MNNQQRYLLQIPESLITKAREFRSHTEDYLSGKSDADHFRHYAAGMGVYAQRGGEVFMVRVRIGSGLGSPEQLRKIADLSKKYANGVLHATTRQDIQLHGVKLENISDIMEELLEVGLATGGGGGNTVRNITTCLRAGLCKDEIFDVTPFAIAAAEYLLAKPESYALPRKFKIVFSGCPTDCAAASVGDIGFFAKIKNGRKGFAVYAAGGLGSNPAVAQKIEDFIPTDDVFDTVEAIRRLFDEHGDRTNRSKARLRYVISRLGKEKFIELYKNYLNEIRQNRSDKVPQIRLDDSDRIFTDTSSETVEIPNLPNVIFPQKQAGLYTLQLHPKFGDIPAGDLSAIADTAESFSPVPLRTTQMQTLVIGSIQAKDIETVLQRLKKLSIDVLGSAKANIVSCTGASTCRLGICDSKVLAKKIAAELNGQSQTSPLIRISGCPNSCGQHWIACLGFQGRATKTETGRAEIYDVLVNADMTESQAHLAEKIGALSPDVIPTFVKKIATEKISRTADIKKLLDSLTQ